MYIDRLKVILIEFVLAGLLVAIWFYQSTLV